MDDAKAATNKDQPQAGSERPGSRHDRGSEAEAGRSSRREKEPDAQRDRSRDDRKPRASKER